MDSWWLEEVGVGVVRCPVPKEPWRMADGRGYQPPALRVDTRRFATLRLADREKDILRRRHDGATLRAVAQELDLSTERVRQMYRHAQGKLGV